MYKTSLVALVTLSVLVVMASSQSESSKPYYDVANDGQKLFEVFIKEHNRVYKDDADRELHYQAFTTNLKKINDMNEKSTSATFGINKFADYTEEESQSMRGFKKTES